MHINPKNIIYLVQVNTNIVGYNMMNANLFPRTLIWKNDVASPKFQASGFIWIPVLV